MSIAARRLSRSARVISGSPPSGTSGWPTGIYYIWGNNRDVFDMTDYVKAGQVVIEWDELQASRGNFNWVDVDDRITNYTNRGMPVVIQINSSNKPNWIYGVSSGVLHKCGTYNTSRFSWDIPHYWGSGKALFMTLMEELLDGIADHMSHAPYKNKILGIRAAPNLIGTEQYDIHPNPSFGTVNMTHPSCDYESSWTIATSKKVYEDVIKLYNPIFLPAGIKPILRSVLFASINTSESLRTELLGMDKAYVFGTNGTPDASLAAVDKFFHDYCVSGVTRGFYEALRENTIYDHPLSWAYWRQLLELGRGISYVATYAADLQGALPGKPYQSEYRAAFDFTNKYAGTQHLPAQAPGAFIAFRPKYHSGDQYSNYDSLITLRNADGSLGGDNSTVGIGSDDGANIIGPTNQRFGRFARRTDVSSGKNTFYLRLSSAFVSSLSGSVNVAVTYLNTGTSSWQLKWTGGLRTFTKNNGGRWTTQTVSVPVSGLKGDLSAGSHLHLVAVGGDTTFHMVEVER